MSTVSTLSLRLLQQNVKPVLFNTSKLSYPICHMTDRCNTCGTVTNKSGIATIHTQRSQQRPDRNPVDGSKEVKEYLNQIRKGDFEKTKVANPEDLKHFRTSKPVDQLNELGPTEGIKKVPLGVNHLPHPIWSDNEVQSVKVTHKEPEGLTDRLSYWTVKCLRAGFDFLSGFNRRPHDETVWLNRICFLETVAGVPGMVAAMVRHLDSLRRMRRDHGWIHTLLEEAENERMHLLTAMQLKKPSWPFRMAVVVSQGTMVTYFSFAYLISPKYCHRLVGYLEEEAVITYSKCLKDIENGPMQHWKTQAAPEMAKLYWNLAPDATMKDVILAIRADEAHHRVVNHTLASIKPDDYNPYKAK